MCLKNIDLQVLKEEKNVLLLVYSVKIDETLAFGHLAISAGEKTAIYISGFVARKVCATPFFFALHADENSANVYIRMWTDIGIYEPEDIVDALPEDQATFIAILEKVLCYVKEKSEELCGVGS